MTVTFIVSVATDRDVVEIPEDRADQLPDGLRTRITAEQPPDGAVVVTPPDGEPLEVLDELWATAQNLCFTVPTTLLTGKDTVRYRCTTWSGVVDAERRGEDIVLTVTDEAPVTVPAGPLLPALVACGERILALHERLGLTALVEHLRPFAQQARDALEPHTGP